MDASNELTTFACAECDQVIVHDSLFCSRSCYERMTSDPDAKKGDVFPHHCDWCGQRVFQGTLKSFCGVECMDANKVRARLRKLNHT